MFCPPLTPFWRVNKDARRNFWICVATLWFSFASTVCAQQPATAAAAQKSAQRLAACGAPEYGQFDYWVGDWDVHSPNGPSVGHNRVTLEQGGCLIVEHWISTDQKHTGTSFNYFDLRDKKWHQLYIDNSGNAGAFPALAGNLVDGKMVLTSDETQTPAFRWTWYPMGRDKVRQMAERSDDGEKSWKVIWDSVYVKMDSAQLKPAARK